MYLRYVMRKPFSDTLVRKTQEVWQPLSKTLLTEQDAEEALRNMLDLCHVLWAIEITQRGSASQQHSPTGGVNAARLDETA